ncbi:MAG: NUDIX domain-containing protein [Pseudomonadota bacterium]
MTAADPDDLSGLTPLTWIEPQAGVLAYQPDSNPIRIVLVTSRRTGRWVFPKGAIDPGMTAPEAAEQEALEEAGIIGTAATTSIGSYKSLKVRPPALWTVEVSIYPLPIDEVLDVWPEADQRTRRFATLEEARQLIDLPDLIEIAENFSREVSRSDSS